MFWQEEESEQEFSIPDSYQDAVLGISCKLLPVDYANLLANALLYHLPWLSKVNAGIHNMCIADGNGWQQSYKKSALFYPSKRTKLIIRLPKKYLEKITNIVGKTLYLSDYRMRITKVYTPRKLTTSTILFAQYVHDPLGNSEELFLNHIANELKKLNIKPKKMMAGLSHMLTTNNGGIKTRALMLADLQKSESVLLQIKGMGDYQLLGCGLFVAQKSINTLMPK